MNQQNQSILVVEDNKDLLNLLEINLTDQGYTVHTALDGQIALDLYESTSPSLIILDIMLPKIDGFERGQLNDRIEVTDNDELSELSVCFKHMADKLVDNMKEIQNSRLVFVHHQFHSGNFQCFDRLAAFLDHSSRITAS